MATIMRVFSKYVVLTALTALVLLGASANVFESIYSDRDETPGANHDTAFWRGVPAITIVNNAMGQPVPGYQTEVRSRWTRSHLYLLFTCPYEKLWLKPNPDTHGETNKLWGWDVAEAFLGSDFEHNNLYREFEVSPQAEWIDLDIDSASPKHEDGWTWNSGFKVAAHVDPEHHVWYAEMQIPWSALMTAAPAEGRELRSNFFLSVGPPENHKGLSWQPTHKRTFHVPEAFGILRLAAAR